MSKTLYVIGNGFDLAHGLETGLRCFKCYLKYKDDASRKFLNSISEYVPFNETWSNFEEALGNIDSEAIKEKAMSYVQSTSSDDFKDSSWGDPAYEASEAVSFSSEISRYLKEWINSVRIEGLYKFHFSDDAVFLTFNYTNTLEDIYSIPKSKICHIHGDCSTDDILICGHNDISLLKEIIVEESDFSVQNQEVVDILHGYYEETWKNPKNHIKEHKDFFEQLSSVETIEIIGHSFENKIDDEYFAYLKETVSSNCKWKISCYSDTDKKNNDSFAQRLGLQSYKSFSINPLLTIKDKK